MSYIFGSEDRELLRLKLQAELFYEESKRTLELAGIREGMRCIDLGCGNGYTTLLLAELVGNDGKVIGIDSSHNAIDAAIKNARDANIDNVEFKVADAYNTGLDASYDLIYSRFLFTHLREPERALDEALRVIKDGGIIVIEDFNHQLRITYPYNEHIERLRTALIELLNESGSKHDIAGMLYKMLRDRGIVASIQLYSICLRMDSKYNIIPLLFAEVLKDRFIRYDIMSIDEYNTIYNGIKEFINNRDAIALYSSVFRVYGRKD